MTTKITILAFAALLFAAPTMAAPAAPTEAGLQKFVAASREVHKISTDSEAKVKAAKTTEEAAKLDDDAGERMEAAVKKQGLTSERYTEIYESMQSDDKVKTRIAAIVGKSK